MKAYTTEDGHIVTFRPDLNAKRMVDSAKRLEMPPFPEDKFVDAIVQTVKANEAYVPPYGTGATLYIRPYMFGINPVIGVKPATDYQFRVFATPVGPYFKGGVKPLTLCVSDFDRAAPHGTGHIKAGLNYAMSLHAIVTAHANGFDENMYLDSATRTKVEETGGANFLFVTKDNTVVTPHSTTILPSITRRSLIADIVQHDAKPHRVQPLDRPQRRLAVVRVGVLRQLHHKAVARKVVLLDDLVHAREDLFVCDGLAREVAREPQRPAPLPLPRLELHARAAEHIDH